MPLSYISKDKNNNGLALWHLEESLDDFAEKMPLGFIQNHQVGSLSIKRQLEWYSGRWLMSYLSTKGKGLIFKKDRFGKPFLVNEHGYISLSHTRGMVGAIRSGVPVGIDVQKVVGKIHRIEKKFLSELELDSLNEMYKTELLHVYWGAKESIYKAYGRKGLDFRLHMRIVNFEYNADGGKTWGILGIEGMNNQRYAIRYKMLENHVMLVWCWLEDVGKLELSFGLVE